MDSEAMFNVPEEQREKTHLQWTWKRLCGAIVVPRKRLYA